MIILRIAPQRLLKEIAIPAQKCQIPEGNRIFRISGAPFLQNTLQKVISQRNGQEPVSLREPPVGLEDVNRQGALIWHRHASHLLDKGV